MARRRTSLGVLEHDDRRRQWLCDILEARRQRVLGYRLERDLLQALHDRRCDGIVLGRPEEVDALDVCARVAEAAPDVPIVVLGNGDDPARALETLRSGASGYVERPDEAEAVISETSRALERLELRRRMDASEQRAREIAGREDLLGTSRAIQRVRARLHRLRDVESNVLVTGESGTGKELVARLLHHQSRRAEEPFVAVSCATLSRDLLESELFGHARGAYTDARTARDGLFVRAGHGTLLLDEVTALPLSMQAKLLRALEERAFRPVGANEIVQTHARVLATTSDDIETEVKEGRFRDDLFYRLDAIRVHLPPLRDRGEDVQLLAHVFLRRLATAMNKPVRGMTPAAAVFLVTYDWPGNVRELRNAMEAAAVLCRHDLVQSVDLPGQIRGGYWRSAHPTSTGRALVALEELEGAHIARVLRAVSGNKSLASRLLAIDRKTLRRKVAHFHLEEDENGRETGAVEATTDAGAEAGGESPRREREAWRNY